MKQIKSKLTEGYRTDIKEVTGLLQLAKAINSPQIPEFEELLAGLQQDLKDSLILDEKVKRILTHTF